ncbi:MAG: hypothetical protein MZV64_73215 [Ignavibacteriales bacterium]|nr:hypothetical protein [Ignavibacteriales bacterium]
MPARAPGRRGPRQRRGRQEEPNSTWPSSRSRIAPGARCPREQRDAVYRQVLDRHHRLPPARAGGQGPQGGGAAVGSRRPGRADQEAVPERGRVHADAASPGASPSSSCARTRRRPSPST